MPSSPAASGPRLGSFAAVLWDMDGTLVDTEPTWMAAEQALAARYGASWSHEQALELVGSDLLDSGRRIREGMGIDLTPAQIVEELLDFVVLEVRRSVPWRPGARELLSSLREAGVPRALVTMSYTRLVDPVLAALPPGTFDAVVTGDVVDRGKPHPEPYLTAARLLDVLASECLAIEDSDTGATSAAAAGCTVLCVPLHVTVPPGPGRVFAHSLADLTASSPLPGADDCGLAPIRNSTIVTGSRPDGRVSPWTRPCPAAMFSVRTRASISGRSHLTSPPRARDRRRRSAVDRTKKVAAVVGAAAIVTALGACGSKNTPAAGNASSNYILGTTDSQVTSLDPAGAYDLPSWTLQYNIYQQLVSYQPGSTKPTPYAAKSCTYTDPSTVKCVLNSGIKYSNGDPMKASDITYSYKRSIVINDPNAASSLLSDLSNGNTKHPDLAKGAIETPNDTTVIFHLNAPDQTFIQALTTPAASIVDPKVYPATKLLPDSQSIGSGPYELSQYQPGQQAVLTANPNYSGPNAPKAAQVIVQYFNSDTTLTQAVGSGKVDVAWRTLSPTELQTLSKNSNVSVDRGKGAEFRYWVFHTQSGPGKSLAVRQAVAQIMDRNAIASRAYNGTVEPAYSNVPPGFLGSDEAFKTQYGAPSVSKAKSILQKAGVSTPISIKLGYTPTHYGPNAVDEANELAQELNSSGLFKATTDDAEWNQYQNLEKQGAYDLYQLGWFPDYLDPDDYLSPFLKDGGFFVNGYSNKQVDKLLGQERAETNASKRTQQIKQIQAIEAKDAPMIPSWFGQNNAVAGKDMTGVANTLDQAYIFRMWMVGKNGS